MSKLDDVLTGYVSASKDARSEGLIDRDDLAEVVEAVKSARAELASLRRRAEDAEMMLRAVGRQNMGRYMMGDFFWLYAKTVDGSLRFDLPIDPTTGLPVLTDEARKALGGAG